MKIEYRFVNGETASVEISGEFEEIILELDKELKSNDRKETRRHESLNSLNTDKQSIDENADVYTEVLKKFDKDKLYTAIAKLKPQEQELIYKFYLNKDRISQFEYSCSVGLSENSIKQKLKRIRKKLKALLCK